jgi:D-3-phosphoglycerate dehydrogenase
MSHRILNIIDEYTKEAKDVLKKVGKTDYLKLNRKSLLEKIGDYDVLLTGLEIVIDKEIMEKGKNLKVIATPTTGLDHIDLNFAKKKGIEILSLKGEKEFLGKISSTAELAFGLAIVLSRKMIPASESVKRYEWQRENFRGDSLRERTMGIVGLGRLGKIMAQYAKAFEMRVVAYDPNLPALAFKKFGCEKASFDKLLKESDIVSIHVHLSKETKNMFKREVFEKMKPSSILINTSRGKIVKEEDVLAALKEKRIAGYGTDVLANELDFKGKFSRHPLVEYAKSHDNLVVLPHIGGMTRQSRSMTDIFIAQKIKKYFNGR